ncbi:glutamate racemase [Salibacteraceae bacterium]|nr:glutamate racemase [Salibacteraceae bacterium]
MDNDQPIGVFDSGVGGLSIWREIHRLLPNESSVYLADSRNAPYGEKGKQAIIDLSVKNTELLLEKGCKLIVVACNTATTNAIDFLRINYNVPFIGIEPATKPAAIATSSKKIGILATKGTLASELFINTSSEFRGDIEIFETIGEGLVPIIESGNLSDAIPLLERYLLPMVEAGVDNIVLGCSHYPFLIEQIKNIVPSTTTIIDSGAAVAKQTKNMLEIHNLRSKNPDRQTQFYTNADVEILNFFLRQMSVTSFKSSYLKF